MIDNKKMMKHMKKVLLLAAAALFALSACQNVETEQAPVDDEIVISLNAAIAPSEGPATRTVYVPEGSKVHWVEGDKIGARYPAANGKYPASLTLVQGGGGQTCGAFYGKITSTTNWNLADNPSDFVFYYPTIANAQDNGTITDADNYTLNNKFPKVQNSADVLFEPNWMVGSVKAQDFLTTLKGNTDKPDTAIFGVSMKNMMAILDFTVKGEGALKRIFVTDMATGVNALYGAEKLVVENGAIKSLALTPIGNKEYDRTIIAEFNKPVALSAEGAHVYVTIFPRAFAKGLRVCFELANGDYMVKKLAENDGFTLEPSKIYTVPAITFASTVEAGKGYYDGVEYSYETITDARDHNVYRVATLMDGKTWMLDNLRFVPEGITPSKVNTTPNNGVWYPVVINAAGTGVQFGTDADVARFGYCYSFSTAMGQAPDFAYNLVKAVLAGTKTAAEAKTELMALEGGQGICPDGWHVPTNAEYEKLSVASGKTISGLGVQGFVLKDVGCVTVNNPTSTNDPTTSGFMGYSSNKMNSGYYLLSTADSHTQSKSVMPNVTENSASTAKMNIRSGAPLRCIKNN